MSTKTFCTREEWNDYHRLLRLVRTDNRPKKIKVSTALTREETNEYYRLRRLAFPEEARAYGRRYEARYREKRNAKNRKWSVEQGPAYYKERRANDLNFKLRLTLRSRLCHALRRYTDAKKSASVIKLVGCSLTDFKIYLESKFEEGMNWENYGREGWHIDHIIPCAIFDLTNSEHQKRCFHFSNMQPMWAFQNRSKGAKCLVD